MVASDNAIQYKIFPADRLCVSSISHHALQKPFDYKVKKCLPNVKFINESETKILSHSFKCIMWRYS